MTPGWLLASLPGANPDRYQATHTTTKVASTRERRTVHEQVDDLVDVVRLLDKLYKFLLFSTRSFHSTFEYFFCRNRPGFRVFESLLDSQRESALFVAPGEP